MVGARAREKGKGKRVIRKIGWTGRQLPDRGGQGIPQTGGFSLSYG